MRLVRCMWTLQIETALSFSLFFALSESHSLYLSLHFFPFICSFFPVFRLSPYLSISLSFLAVYLSESLSFSLSLSIYLNLSPYLCVFEYGTTL